MQEPFWPHIKVGSRILKSFMSWSGCWQAESLWEQQFLAGSYSNNNMRGNTSPRTSSEDHTNSGRLLASMGKKRPCNWVVFSMCCMCLGPAACSPQEPSWPGSALVSRSWWLWRYLILCPAAVRCRSMDMTHEHSKNHSRRSWPKTHRVIAYWQGRV